MNSIKLFDDLSLWNPIKDFDSIDKSISGIIVKCGYRGTVKGAISKDYSFEKNIVDIKEHKIPVGVSFYTRAINTNEIKDEVKFITNLIESNNIDISFPIILNISKMSIECDRFYTQIDNETRTELIKYFIKECNDKDYNVIIKLTVDTLKNYFNYDKLQNVYKILIDSNSNEDEEFLDKNYIIGRYSNHITDFYMIYDEKPEECAEEVEEEYRKSELVVGDKITFPNVVNLYKTTKSSDPEKQISGAYYIFDSKKLFGRVRVCKTKSACVKQDKDKVIGWVNASDILL